MDTELEFNLKTGSASSVTKQVKSIASNSVTIKNSFSSQTSFGSDKTIAKVNIGINNEATNSVTESFESSVTRAVSETNEFSKNVSFKFDKNTTDVGYYCYTSLASLKIYEAVVYNPETSQIDEMTPYTIVGKAMPGLLYSKTSFFMYNTPKIEFDISKVNSFPKPQTMLDKKVNVTFNANGGSCDMSNKTYSISEQYGALPTPKWHGHNFLGWYQNDNLISENDIVISGDPIVAKWDVLTKKSFTIDRYQAQNGFGSSEEMDTSSVEVPLSNYLDIKYLKDNNYNLRITIDYDVDYLTFGLGKLHYQLRVNNGESSIYKIEDSINGSTHRLFTSPQISPSSYDGVLTLNLYTENIQGVVLTNCKITFEFVK